MIDQYGKPVPDDLVFLDIHPEDYPGHLEDIRLMDWYEPDPELHPRFGGGILVSYAALVKVFSPYLPPCETNPEDVLGGPLRGVLYISNPLHRESEEDGFYHA